jgi:hypothetical protein
MFAFVLDVLLVVLVCIVGLALSVIFAKAMVWCDDYGRRSK